MIEFTKWEIGRTEKGREKEGLILFDNDWHGIFSLMKQKNGSITFCEECDGYFSIDMSKEDAKIALLEALAWIDEE